MSIESGGTGMQKLAVGLWTDPNILFRSLSRIAISPFASSC